MEVPKFLWHVTSMEHRSSILCVGLTAKWSAFVNEHLVWAFGSQDHAESAVAAGLIEGDILFRIESWGLDVKPNPHPWHPGQAPTWVIVGDVSPSRLVPYRLDVG